MCMAQDISFTLNNGRTIPALGYGVFQMTSAEVREHLPRALELGYRHVDTANAYFNEVAVGEVLRDCITAGDLTREDVFLTSKLFPQSYPFERCGADIDATLERLGVDYLDLLLLHQPYGAYVEGWRAMEEAVDAGKVRSIGLSNFSAAKAREILDIARIAPAVNQVEINPRWNQHALKDALEGTGIVFEGWYPLGHGDPALLAEAPIAAAADRTGATPAQVVLAWQLSEGNVVFPKTLDRAHMADNLAAADLVLTPEEVAAITALPQRPYYEVPEEMPGWLESVLDFTHQR